MIRILGTRDGLKDRDSEQFFGCYRVIGTANAHIDRYESSFGAWLRQHLRQSRGGLFQQTARRRCVYERRGVMPNASRRRLPFSSSTPDAYEKRNV